MKWAWREMKTKLALNKAARRARDSQYQAISISLSFYKSGHRRNGYLWRRRRSF